MLYFYSKRAYTIGVKLNLLAEENYQEALELAKKYDKMRQETPELCKR